MVYRVFFRLVLRRIPAETAHRLAFALIRFAGKIPFVRPAMQKVLAPKEPVLRTTAFGVEFPGPLGLAAGFDKDARGVDALAMLGFGYVEVGTVTAKAQPGNPKPRMFRLPADHGVINRMGFNNEGAGTVAKTLTHRKPKAITGVNIGKTKVVEEQDAIDDYLASTQLLASFADYFVVNVSSPNTPGLRDLQAVGKLRPLLFAVRKKLDETNPGRRVPLLVKIAPDLADEDVDAVADLALELELDGIVATNTTISRDNLTSDPGETGGLSGKPLRKRSLEVLRRLRAKVGDRIVLVAAGGIETGDDAWERIVNGATLVQAYTGFIYGGPLWPRRVHKELARRAEREGVTRLADAVGREVG